MCIFAPLGYGNLSKLGGRMESDAAFFTRRAQEEKLAATRADHPQARKAHLQMAARYADLARAIDGKPLDYEDRDDDKYGRPGIWF